MADEPIAPREIPYLRLFPWIRIFRGVGTSLDAKKLILAALGLGLSIAGWGLLDRLFPGDGLTLPITADRPGWPFDGLRGPEDPGTIASVVRGAAATVAEPARTLIAPFGALFAIGAGARALGHAALAAVWGALVWGIIGGAIARIALVQVAKGERIGMVPALRFAARKASSLIGAPLTPLVGVAFFAILCGLLGLLYRIPSPVLHSVLGALAFLPLLAGLVMAIILLGLAAGWPLMHATVAAEGEDTFDALSRSYAYVYQRPGRYASYAVLAWALGTIGLLFVAVFARSVVGLALWALSLGAPADLLMALFRGGPATGPSAPAAVHAAWIAVVGLLARGWVYSYFWTSASIIYLLLRHDVDGTDWDDIALPASVADDSIREPESAPERAGSAGPIEGAAEPVEPASPSPPG
jgi:hypothetical protein